MTYIHRQERPRDGCACFHHVRSDRDSQTDGRTDGLSFHLQTSEQSVRFDCKHLGSIYRDINT